MKLTIDPETSEEVLAIWCCHLIAMYDSTIDPVPWEARDHSTFYAAHDMYEASIYARELADVLTYRGSNGSTMKQVSMLIDRFPRVPIKLPDFSEGD